MAKTKLGNRLVPVEIRDRRVIEVKAIIEDLKESLHPDLLQQVQRPIKKKLEAFRDQLPHFEAQLLIELRDGQLVPCTYNEAELAIDTARRLHLDFIMMMQPNEKDRKKIVRDFFKFARDAQFSRITKTLFATGWATAIGFTVGALLFTLAFNVAVPIALGVAAGIGLIAGIITAFVTYRRAKNPHEESERGKKERDCLNSIVSVNENDLEQYITLRSQFFAMRAQSLKSQTMRSSLDSRQSLKKPPLSESKPSKSGVFSFLNRGKSDSEADSGKENVITNKEVGLTSEQRAANRRAAFARASTVSSRAGTRPGLGRHQKYD